MRTKASAAILSRRPIPILCYHSVTNDPQGSIARFTVPPGMLARHLDILVAGGHSALPVSGLTDLLERNIEPPPGTVVLTFDDGFADNLTVAAPMLADRGLPATVYVTTGYLPGCPGGSARPAAGAMIPWRDLVDLESAGLEVGSHAHSHRPLDVLSAREVSDEIHRSRDLLENALGHRVASFAYPHGYASPAVQRQVRRWGFRSACGVRNAFSHRQDNRLLLSRLTVYATTTLNEVENWMSGVGAPMAADGEQWQTKAWRVARRASALGDGLVRSNH